MDTVTTHGTNLILVHHIILGIILSDSITGTLLWLFSDREAGGTTIITDGEEAAIITDTRLTTTIIITHITPIIITLLPDTLQIIPQPEEQITARDQAERIPLPEDHKQLIHQEL